MTEKSVMSAASRQVLHGLGALAMTSTVILSCRFFINSLSVIAVDECRDSSG